MNKRDKFIDINYTIESINSYTKIHPKNTLKALKNIIALTTLLNLDDYEVFCNKVKLEDDNIKLIHVENNTPILHLNFISKSKHSFINILL